MNEGKVLPCLQALGMEENKGEVSFVDQDSGETVQDGWATSLRTTLGIVASQKMEKCKMQGAVQCTVTEQSILAI